MTAAEIKAAELNGMKEICSFAGYSESTILGWIRDLGFPAKKLGGVWISDGHEIAEWRKAYLRNEIDEYIRRRANGRKRSRRRAGPPQKNL